MAIFRIRPEFYARPWGRVGLSPIYANPPRQDEPIGEVWLTDSRCQVKLPHNGGQERSLGDSWTQMGRKQRGTDCAHLGRFPLLVKFIFTLEKLSIQVHPDDANARAHEGEPWGKTEAWYMIDAQPEAWVKVGFRPGLKEETIREAWGKPEVEEMLHTVGVRAGDVAYVPAGTIHAIGPGVCLCEVQQYSDVTYRVYDYDRLGLDGKKRELHTEKALAVTRFSTPAAGKVAPKPLGPDTAGGELLIRSPYFVIEKYGCSSSLRLPIDPAHFSLFVTCGGRGTIGVGTERMEFGSGNSFLVTADSKEVELGCVQPTELLHVYCAGPGPLP